LKNPKSIRDAVVVSEILKPKYFWARDKQFHYKTIVILILTGFKSLKQDEK
jgi:hypothetical protein